MLQIEYRIEARKVAAEIALAHKTLGELQASTSAERPTHSKEQRKTRDASGKATETLSGIQRGDKPRSATRADPFAPVAIERAVAAEPVRQHPFDVALSAVRVRDGAKS